MDLSIVIPAYNEAANLPLLIKRITESVPKGLKYEIIVVNDNSTDNTLEVLKKLEKKYKVLKHIDKKAERGVGTTIALGIRNAKGKFIITMDADLSHNPKYIHQFLEKIKECDMVIGSRYTEKGGMENTLLRKIVSRGFTLYARLMGLKVKDATSGYRIFRSEIFKDYEFKSKGFDIHIEIPMVANIKGYKIKEIPIVYEKRFKGKSKLKYAREGPRYVLRALRCRLNI